MLLSLSFDLLLYVREVGANCLACMDGRRRVLYHVDIPSCLY